MEDGEAAQTQMKAAGWEDGTPDGARRPTVAGSSYARKGMRTMPSSESLKAHPLEVLAADGVDSAELEGSRALQTRPTADPTSIGLKPSSTVYHVNYKARQRPPSTSSISLPQTVTTTAPATPSTPPSETTKLQMQSLQASLQKIGIHPDTVGWAIVHKLSTAPSHEEEWKPIFSALSTGKAFILLPSEHGSADVSARTIKNHVLLRDGKNVATLSGLKGVKTVDHVSFTTVMLDDPEVSARACAQVQAVLASSRAVPAHVTMPSVALGEEIGLQIPRHKVSGEIHTTPPSRIGQKRTLATLFGGQRPAAVAAQVSVPGHVQESPESAGVSSQSTLPTLEVTAFAIDRVQSFKKLGRAIQASVEQQIRQAFEPEDAKVADMVLQHFARFRPMLFRQPTSPLFPTSTKPAAAKQQDSASPHSLLGADAATLTSATQELLHDVRQRYEEAEQERLALAEILREDVSADEKEKAAPELSSRNVDALVQAVEAFVCEMLYDRMFCPVGSQDRVDDESLATRIAGLHMLDVELGHLGLQVEEGDDLSDSGDARDDFQADLREIVAMCGKELERLEEIDCRSPAAKAQVLVRAHKIIADGLERLPSIRIRDVEQSRPTAASMTGTPYDESQGFELTTDTSTTAGPGQRPDTPTLVDRTPRLPTSRPLSRAGSVDVPALALPDASLREYGIRTHQDDGEVSLQSGLDRANTPPYKTTPQISIEQSSIQPQAKKKAAGTTSADAILPLLIYCLVQTNPSRLVSHVMFVQRFRADSLMRGEEEYCLCNMDAARQFLMSCDIGSLGLGTDKIISSAGNVVGSPPQALRMRHRAGQQIDSMVGSAGRVLGQAADLGMGGYRLLGGLLATKNATDAAGGIDAAPPRTIEDVQNVLSGETSRAASFRDSILRRSTISSVVPSLTSGKRVDDTKKDGEVIDVEPAQDERRASTSSTQPFGDTLAAGDAGEKPSTGSIVPAPSISSRLASLPGLSRFSASGGTQRQASSSSVAACESAGDEFQASADRPSLPSPVPARMGGLMSVLSSSPLLNIGGSTRADTSFKSTGGQDDSSVAERISTSTMGPKEQTLHNRVASAASSIRSQSPASSILSGNASQSGHGASSRLYTASSPSFMSHSQHHDYLQSKHDGAGSVASSLSSRISGLPMADKPVLPSTGRSLARGDSAWPQPLQRFLNISPEQLTLGDVSVLLEDYKRLAAQVERLRPDGHSQPS